MVCSASDVFCPVVFSAYSFLTKYYTRLIEILSRKCQCHFFISICVTLTLKSTFRTLRFALPVSWIRSPTLLHSSSSLFLIIHQFFAFPLPTKNLPASQILPTSGRYRLRSTGSAAYVLPRTRTKFGERGFFYSDPDAWNTLPSNLHDITDTSTFRKRLKHVLFDRAYNWLLLALLDESYSGALQISRWLIDWLTRNYLTHPADWLHERLLSISPVFFSCQ